MELATSVVRRGGALMSRNVLDIRYFHVESRQRTPYVHPFGAGVHMIANADGSITLRHPTRRLWEDRVVSEDE